MEINVIYNEDCLEGMKRIPDKSINLIVTDPPYNIGKAEWDKIPNYIEWMGIVFLECQRVLKDNGSFYWFHNDMPQIAQLMEWIRQNTKFVFKQLIVWNKRYETSPRKYYFDNVIQSNIDRNYRLMAEYCLFYTFQDETGSNEAAQKSARDYLRDERDKAGYKNKDINILLGYPSNGGGYASHYFGECITQCSIPTKEHYDKLQQTGYFKKSYEELRRSYESLRQEYEAQRYTFNNQKTHHSVWDYEIAKKQGHITPKPVELIENILLHSSNEDDTVLDCFMGSGTTATAALNTGRFFIGYEMDKQYYDIAIKRIQEHTQQVAMV